MDTAPQGMARASEGVRLSQRGVSFVIRLWLEAREREAPPEWRWHVLHVQSDRERYGRRLQDLIAFIGEQSGVEPPSLELR